MNCTSIIVWIGQARPYAALTVQRTRRRAVTRGSDRRPRSSPGEQRLGNHEDPRRRPTPSTPARGVVERTARGDEVKGCCLDWLHS